MSSKGFTLIASFLVLGLAVLLAVGIVFALRLPFGEPLTEPEVNSYTQTLPDSPNEK